jgi:hypothetical protein
MPTRWRKPFDKLADEPARRAAGEVAVLHHAADAFVDAVRGDVLEARAQGEVFLHAEVFRQRVVLRHVREVSLGARGSSATETPQMAARPEVPDMVPERMRMVVDLPAPFGPRKPTISPGATEKLRSSTAVERPVALGQPFRHDGGFRLRRGFVHGSGSEGRVTARRLRADGSPEDHAQRPLLARLVGGGKPVGAGRRAAYFPAGAAGAISEGSERTSISLSAFQTWFARSFLSHRVEPLAGFGGVALGDGDVGEGEHGETAEGLGGGNIVGDLGESLGGGGVTGFETAEGRVKTGAGGEGVDGRGGAGESRPRRRASS